MFTHEIDHGVFVSFAASAQSVIVGGHFWIFGDRAKGPLINGGARESDAAFGDFDVTEPMAGLAQTWIHSDVGLEAGGDLFGVAPVFEGSRQIRGEHRRGVLAKARQGLDQRDPFCRQLPRDARIASGQLGEDRLLGGEQRM